MKKQKFKNLAIFLLCSIFLTLFEPFGTASANAAINRSISSESDKNDLATGIDFFAMISVDAKVMCIVKTAFVIPVAEPVQPDFLRLLLDLYKDILQCL